MPEKRGTTRSQRRSRLLLLAAMCPLLQIGSCALFDGGLLERTLTGVVFNPLATTLFQQFYNLGAGL